MWTGAEGRGRVQGHTKPYLPARGLGVGATPTVIRQLAFSEGLLQQEDLPEQEAGGS